MVESLAYPYTSETEIKRLYGKKGFQNITADLAGTDLADAILDAIADATTTIDAYASQIYAQVDLAQSRWVRERAKWIAAYRLSQRAGAPDLFSQRYAEIIEELEKVKDMEIMIPNLPTSADLTPALSNLYIDPNYEVDKIRVYPSTSTGGNSSRQSLSWRYPVDWF